MIELIIAKDARRRSKHTATETTAVAASVKSKKKAGNNYHHQKTDTRKQQSYRRTTEIVCWNCNKRGHKAAVCRSPKKKSNTTQQNQQKQQSANFAEVFMAIHSPQTEGTEVNEGTNDVTYLIDSGASCHMFTSRDQFTEYTPLDQSWEVSLADYSSVKALGTGTAELAVRSGDKRVNSIFKDAQHVPMMTQNLISVNQLLEEGFRCTFTSNGVIISKNRKRILARSENKLYKLDVSVIKPVANLAAMEATEKSPVSLKEAHEILAHVGKDKVRRLLTSIGPHLLMI